MKLYEYMAKQIFAEYDIPTPHGHVATDVESVRELADHMDGAVAIKAQVLAGGRGKAGGIKFADTPAEAARAAEELFGTDIRGFKVERLLVEEKLSIDQEIYLGITVDGGTRQPLLIGSLQGGVNIEEVPEREIIKRPVDVTWGLFPFEARELVRRLELEGPLARQMADIATRLYEVFCDYDAELVEINPLVVCDGELLAADGRLNVDEDALFRHEGLPNTSEATPTEQEVRAIGLSYVELDGDIAIMANGAGVTMATIDILEQYGGKAMNFLDAGGGASMEPMAQALNVLVRTKPKAILINIFGGITRCDDVANAIIQVKEERGIPMPLVVRLVGTNEDEGVEILRKNGIEAFRTMDRAAKAVVERAS